MAGPAAAVWPLQLIKPEVTYGASRLDFYFEAPRAAKTYAEVKGVTLEENGTALFPDAPTQRGVRHLQELVAAKQQGYGALATFVIQMENATAFAPNRKTHPAFATALAAAAAAGVQVLALSCTVTETSLAIQGFVPVVLGSAGV